MAVSAQVGADFKAFAALFWRPHCPSCRKRSVGEYINCSHWTCLFCLIQFCGACHRGYARGDDHQHDPPCFTYYKQMGNIRMRVEKKGYATAYRYTSDGELQSLMDGIEGLRERAPTASERARWQWTTGGRPVVNPSRHSRRGAVADAAVEQRRRKQTTRHNSQTKTTKAQQQQQQRLAAATRDRAKRNHDRGSRKRLKRAFTNNRNEPLELDSDNGGSD